ncbi:alpha/beta hydrolase [Sphingomonas sp. Leaf34]|uniref:alpha/beta hydrolase n=1 Tax=Sphingomonas sp. Leaf34 TaxID=1736216 RepID=UPI0009EA091B|nr:alpha/beta hydrolase-fold protein [Sphingomonas sp. Leaf34]
MTLPKTGFRRSTMTAVLVGVALATNPSVAQVDTNATPAVVGAKLVTIERIKVHGASIVGNLEGNAADRDVIVILPPGYAADRKRRYPVVYALHGYSIGAAQWIGEIHVPQTVEGAFAKGARPMILVLPDAKTVHNGSMYSSSVTTGDFETFVARDLIAYIDAHYRTIARRESRGLAGHSMGGYGTTRIGLKHADMFGALYMMSPCCLSPRDAKALDPAIEDSVRALRSAGDAATLSWGTRAQLASAAAWSPDPAAPPLFLDLPIKNGVVQPDVLARWAANAPLAMLDQYVGNLRRYRAIAIDVGDKDDLKDDAARLHAALDRYGIANNFTIYPGTHTSNVALRFQDHVVPFFSQHLVFDR